MRSGIFYQLDQADGKNISLEEYRDIILEIKEDIKQNRKIVSEVNYACEQLRHFTELFDLNPKTQYAKKATKIAIESAFKRNRIPSYISVVTEEDKRNFIQKIIDWILEKLKAIKDWITSFFKKKKIEAFEKKAKDDVVKMKKAFEEKKSTTNDDTGDANSPDNNNDNASSSTLSKPYKFVFHFDGSKFKITDVETLLKLKTSLYEESEKIFNYNVSNIEKTINDFKEFVKDPSKYSSADDFYAKTISSEKLNLSAKQINIKGDSGEHPKYLYEGILFNNSSKNGLLILEEEIHTYLDKKYYVYSYLFKSIRHIDDNMTDDIYDYYGKDAKPSLIIEHNKKLHNDFFTNVYERDNFINVINSSTNVGQFAAKVTSGMCDRISKVTNEINDIKLQYSEEKDNPIRTIISGLLYDLKKVTLSQYHFGEHILYYYSCINDLFDKGVELANDKTIAIEI